MHLMRIIVSGVFYDRFPKLLQIIAGHGGEGLPYWLCRMDLFQRNYRVNNRFPHISALKRNISDYIKENIPVTSSGMAWAPVILFMQQVVGPDRVMYAMDYPYQYDIAEVKVTDEIPISDAADEKKFYQTNAEARSSSCNVGPHSGPTTRT